MSTQDIRNPEGVIYNVQSFTYNEIDTQMIEMAYKLLKYKGNLSLPIHFEMSSKIYTILSDAINKFGGNPGEMLNGFKFMRNIKLEETEIKVELY